MVTYIWHTRINTRGDKKYGTSNLLTLVAIGQSVLFTWLMMIWFVLPTEGRRTSTTKTTAAAVTHEPSEELVPQSLAQQQNCQSVGNNGGACCRRFRPREHTSAATYYAPEPVSCVAEHLDITTMVIREKRSQFASVASAAPSVSAEEPEIKRAFVLQY